MHSERNKYYYAALFIVVFMGIKLIILTGCVPNNAAEREAPFEVTELESVMAIVIDVSGSFRDKWDADAYRMFVNLSQRFFEESAGGEARLIISQLSANKQAVLFEGHPSDLRKRFRSPEEFSQFLLDNSDPSSSRVYDATRQTIDYMNGLEGVTESTRILTVILSDLRDSESDGTIRGSTGQAMLDSLSAYQQRGGALALYYVANEEIARWREVISRAGFEPGFYTIETEISAKPRLPDFQ